MFVKIYNISLWQGRIVRIIILSHMTILICPFYFRRKIFIYTNGFIFGINASFCAIQIVIKRIHFCVYKYVNVRTLKTNYNRNNPRQRNIGYRKEPHKMSVQTRNVSTSNLKSSFAKWSRVFAILYITVIINLKAY